MPYIGRPLNAGNLAVQSGTGDGADTTPIATLDYSVGSSNSIGVYLDGVRQLAGTDFTASGTVLTFTTAPANGVGIDVYFLGLELSIPTPADDTVTGAKIVDNAINSEHYTDGSIDTAHIAVNQIDETLMKDAFVADFGEVVIAAGDSILLGDATDSGNTKRDTVQGILDLASASGVGVLVNITYNTATASGNVDVTGFGFEPTSFIAFGGIGNATKYTYGMGIVGGIDMNVNSRDGSTTMNTGHASSIIIETAAGSATRVSSTSSISDGIRLVWSKNGSPSGSALIGIIGFK